jgi:hypothetical protein
MTCCRADAPLRVGGFLGRYHSVNLPYDEESMARAGGLAMAWVKGELRVYQLQRDGTLLLTALRPGLSATQDVTAPCCFGRPLAQDGTPAVCIFHRVPFVHGARVCCTCVRVCRRTADDLKANMPVHFAPLFARCAQHALFERVHLGQHETLALECIQRHRDMLQSALDVPTPLCVLR